MTALASCTVCWRQVELAACAGARALMTRSRKTLVCCNLLRSRDLTLQGEKESGLPQRSGVARAVNLQAAEHAFTMAARVLSALSRSC